jgi:hypothetical protein
LHGISLISTILVTSYLPALTAPACMTVPHACASHVAIYTHAKYAKRVSVQVLYVYRNGLWPTADMIFVICYIVKWRALQVVEYHYVKIESCRLPRHPHEIHTKTRLRHYKV